jgi:hypothetical protein
MRVCRIPRARCERYVAAGWSIPRIAEAEGWSVGSIKRHLQGLGISRSRVIVTHDDVLSVIEGRETVRQVAERLRVSRPAVYQRAHRSGFRIERRRPGPAQLDLFQHAA